MFVSLTRCMPMAAAGLLLCCSPAMALDWRAQPHYGTANLSSGFRPDPHTVTVKAGGNSSASQARSGCAGYVSTAPDYDINYDAQSYELSISAVAAQDITLVVYDAAGNWHCNDDFSSSTGTNPAITWSDPPSGNYNIWVGTYQNGGYENATLYITEGDPF